ncbi:MAG: 3'-5' exonuclease [Elusimicrobiaceae bacterium]|nr:3'-5' exonuclease [Elusimicrobiaceae bacterium]
MTPIENIKFACLDTETTGLCAAAGGKICEIAVSVSQNGQKLEEFSTLLNPQMPMHPDVIAIHGITNEMVAGAPVFADIVPQLLGLLEGCVLVAHNADFDLGFLRQEMQNCGLRFPEYPVLDTLKLARKNGKFERNKLGVIAQTLGISADGAHRAMADVRMTEKILYCFLQDFMKEGVRTWEELAQYQFKRHEAVVLGSTVFSSKK